MNNVSLPLIFCYCFKWMKNATVEAAFFVLFKELKKIIF